MFTAILSALGGKFIDGFFTSALQAFTAYTTKQITEAQLREQLLQAMLTAAKDLDVAAYDALTKTYGAFMTTMDHDQSLLMKRCWAATVLSQLFVLLWHQWFIPVIVVLVRWYWVDAHWNYPSSGSTVEWAYLLLGGLMGMAPMVLRSGPGAGNMLERMKSAIGGK